MWNFAFHNNQQIEQLFLPMWLPAGK